MSLTLSITPYRLPRRAPWPDHRTAGNTWVEGWLLRLSGPEGVTGTGDCRPLPAAGTESRKQARDQLQKWDGAHISDPSPLLEQARNCPAARCALETAWLDLNSRRRHLPLRHLLSETAADAVAVNALLGAACPTPAPPPEFRVLKLKLGHRPWKEELACLQTMADRLAPGQRLRLDANGAWSFHEAKAMLKALAALPVESVEEPLAHPTTDALSALQGNTSIPLAVDESLGRLGMEPVLQARPVRRLVFKPMALGGPGAALTCARRAHAAGLQTVITSVGESAVGLAATAQLAAVVEGFCPGLHHGLATAAWLQRDLAPPPPIERGILRLSTQPGIGVET